MAHLLTSDDRFRDLSYDDGYRAYLITRREPLGDTGLAGRRENAFASTPPRLAPRQRYFRNLIEAIANSKVRRMERELELRGIRLTGPTTNWVTRNPVRAASATIDTRHSALIAAHVFAWRSHATVFVHDIVVCFLSAQRFSSLVRSRSILDGPVRNTGRKITICAVRGPNGGKNTFLTRIRRRHVGSPSNRSSESRAITA